MQVDNKMKFWLPFGASLLLALGMILGTKLQESLRNKRDLKFTGERSDRLEQLIDLIKERYVDTIATDDLYNVAVAGIINRLDPHTVYIPAENLTAVNEELEGSFFGIGIEYSLVTDTITVIDVLNGSPAQQAGMAIGDQILKVNDSIVAGKSITSEGVTKLLRGAYDSEVLVLVSNVFNKKQNTLKIKRGSIPISSIDASFMINDSLGYIRINKFSATTYEDFMLAIKDLKAKKMTQLVLDLRQNPGGYLEAAINIADEFIGGNPILVYTKGKSSSKNEYKAGKPGVFEQGKLIVLIDEQSASASEILAGAIQDLDRGIIIGRRSYGKGLVQEQFDLQDGSALRLTVARYYTPSGRCIQRSYKEGNEQYAHDFEQRLEDGELTGASKATLTDTAKYFTTSKRVVYGGGGITPDVMVAYDSSMLNINALHFINSEWFERKLWDYYVNHFSELKKMTTPKMFIQSFKVELMMEQIYHELPSTFTKVGQKIAESKKIKQYVNDQAKAILAKKLFQNNGYYQAQLTVDPMFNKIQELSFSKLGK